MTSSPVSLEEGFEALEKFDRYFGFARLYRCVDGWYVSNHTDEGIGGDDPCIRAYGKTPQEALIAAAQFLRDPKLPAPIPCPGCGKTTACHEFMVNKKGRREAEFFCWGNGDSCGCIFLDDICPSCMGSLEVIEDEAAGNRTQWEAKCLNCGKIFPRGSDAVEEYPDLKMEPLDLDAIGVDNA